MRNALLLTFLVCLANLTIQAQYNESYIPQNSPSIPFTLNATNTTEDPTSVFTNFNTLTYSSWLTFEYIDQKAFYIQNLDFKMKIEVELTCYKDRTKLPDPPIKVILELTHYKNQSLDNTNFIFREIGNFQKIDYEIKSIQSSLTNYDIFKLGVHIKQNRIYTPELNPTISFSPLFSSFTTYTKSNINLSWTPPKLCDEYDLEWAFIDESSQNFQDYLLNNSSYDPSLYKSLTFSRITTKFPLIEKFPLIYNKGKVLFRIRTVYYDQFKRRITSNWIEKDASNNNLELYVTNHEKKLNWTSSINIAEDGKHKEVVSYFDGIQRDRQSVTYDYTKNKPIISESFYDFEGRKAANILPAPSFETNPSIKFYKNFNLSDISNKPYKASDLKFNLACGELPEPLDSSDGAARYYSLSNPEKELDYNRFIPHTKGYPISAIQYTNDNTGRILKQGGVGDSFQIGNNHDTRFFYEKAPAYEINRLFGTDVGFSNHIFKNSVTDPNGQISVSYIDMSGKTLATSLAGASKYNYLQPLKSLDTSNLRDTILFPDDFKPDYSKHQSTASSSMSISLNQFKKFYIGIDSAVIVDSCLKTHCSDCYYDFNIKIKGVCVPVDKDTTYRNYPSLDNIDTICDNDFLGINDSFEIFMPEGQYFVSSSITVPSKVIEYYTKRYMDNDSCLLTLDSFIKKHINRIKPWACIKTCEECKTFFVEPAGRAKYIQTLKDDILKSGQQLTQEIINAIEESADSAAKSCDKFCTSLKSCDIVYKMLLSDVSPGGQYAFNYNPVTKSYDYQSSTSVITKSMLVYLDIKKPKTGDVYEIPQDLATLARDWRPEWAEKLVKFHPEYCGYEHCLVFNRDDILDKLDQTLTFSEAITKGYFDFNSVDYGLKKLITDNDKFNLEFTQLVPGPGYIPKFGNCFLSELMNGKKLKDTNGVTIFDPIDVAQYALLMSNPNYLKHDAINYRYYVDINDFMTNACDGMKNMFWMNYKNLIMSTFRKMYDLSRSNCGNPCVTNTYSLLSANPSGNNSGNDATQPPNGDNGTGSTACSCPNSALNIGKCLSAENKKSSEWFIDTTLNLSPTEFPYCTKTPRFYNTFLMNNDFNNNLNSSNLSDMKAKAAADLIKSCDQNCTMNAEGWMSALKDCNFIYTGKTITQIKNELKQSLIYFCNQNCDYDHPYGATTVKSYSLLINNKYCNSFQDVIDIYYNSSNVNDKYDCSADLIDLPKPYYVKPYYETRATLSKIEPCVCDRITELGKKYGPIMTGSFASGRYVTFFNPQFVINLRNAFPEDTADLTYETVKMMYESCVNKDTNCIFLPKVIVIPRHFDCINSIDCDQYRLGKYSFAAKYPNLKPPYKLNGDPKYIRLFAGHINNMYGMHLSYYDYIEFDKKCAPCQEPCDSFILEKEEILRIKGSCDSVKKTGGTGGNNGNGEENPPVGGINPELYNSNTFNSLTVIEKKEISNLVNLISKSANFSLPPLVNSSTFSSTSPPFGPISTGIFGREFENVGPCGPEGSIQVDENGDCYSCLGWMDPIAQVCYTTLPPGGCPQCVPYKIYYTGEFCDSIKKSRNDSSKTCDTCYKIVIYKCINGGPSGTPKFDTVKTKMSQADCNKKSGVNPGPCDGFTPMGIAAGGNTGNSNGFTGFSMPIFKQSTNESNAVIKEDKVLFYTINPYRKVEALKLMYGEAKYQKAVTIITEINSIPASISYDNYTPPGEGWPPTDTPKVYPDTCNYRLYDKPMSPRVKPKNPCREELEGIAISSAMKEYADYLETMKYDFRNRYVKKCLDDANGRVSHRGKSNTHHFTLYYYGQDGNLLKTVPPAGVNLLDDKTAYAIDKKRESKADIHANHDLATTYKYNSLNQVYEQNTPDAGTSRFVYDQLGRLILSQNSKQAEIIPNSSSQPKIYSYTIYDYLSRIIETGEIDIDRDLSTNDFSPYFNLDYKKYADYLTDLAYYKSLNKTKLRYVTRTYYDKYKFNSVMTPMNGIQENLKNRISSITLDTLDVDKGADPSSYHSALHYSYDVLGNVKKLVSENKISPFIDHRFKLVEYDYDLASGKVNQVSYQKTKSDQFFYKYEYDQENKLKAVYTSTNELQWEQDADYEYYVHGPLARTVLGQREVQGIDYAYTLQGWLKSVNADLANSERDMGQDGFASPPHTDHARDAVAFTLNYYKHDYEQIGRRSNPIQGVIASSMLDQPIYNGNITSSVVSNIAFTAKPVMGYKYSYDQLHRIIKFDALNDAITATNDYKERVSYDPNGNIESYLRFKDNATMMDSLTYKYATKKNQLLQVNDAVGNAVYNLDIDNQSNATNYEYDKIGNLIEDKQAQLKIKWTPTGKIAEIKDLIKNQLLTFVYDPMGNRIMKKVSYPGTTKTPITTYYQRDAQGNTLAVYDNHLIDLSLVDCKYTYDKVDFAFNTIEGILMPCAPLYDPACIAGYRPNLDIQLLGKDSCTILLHNYIWAQTSPCTLNPGFMGFVAQFYNDFNAAYSSLTLPADQIAFIDQKVADYDAMYGFGIDFDCFKEKVSKGINMNSTDFNNYFGILSSNQEYGFWKADLINSIHLSSDIKYLAYKDTIYADSLYWQEQHLYGSSRLGMALLKREVSKPNLQPFYDWMVGRRYELTNHLGNVLATIKDEKQQIEKNGAIDYFEPIITSAQDYYPFGMPMPNRTYSLSSGSKYRFGFNGQEKDDEVYGEGNLVNFGARIHDTRIGRWFSVDKHAINYPFLSVYSYVNNNPIKNIEIDGKDWGDINVIIILNDNFCEPITKQVGDWIVFKVNNLEELNGQPGFNAIRDGTVDNLQVVSHGLGVKEKDISGIALQGENNKYHIYGPTDAGIKYKKGLRPGFVLPATPSDLDGLKKIIKKLDDESSILFFACGAGKEDAFIDKLYKLIEDESESEEITLILNKDYSTVSKLVNGTKNFETPKFDEHISNPSENRNGCIKVVRENGKVKKTNVKEVKIIKDNKYDTDQIECNE